MLVYKGKLHRNTVQQLFSILNQSEAISRKPVGRIGIFLHRFLFFFFKKKKMLRYQRTFFIFI